MSSRINHHYLPQFYFRNFSNDGVRINLLNKKRSRIVLEASIKHQCTRARFYGPDEVEESFSKCEASIAGLLREFVEISRCGHQFDIDESAFVNLAMATIFQKGRTVQEAEKHAPAHEKMHLEWFKLHLLNKGETALHDKLVEADRLGQVKVTEDRRQTMGMVLSTLM